MEQDTKKLVAYVYASKLRREILTFLSTKSPARPMEITRGIYYYQSHVSNALKELEKKGVIECLTPEKSSWRVYNITETGKKVVNELK